jgi:ABC-type nitrate/sulfonate/bicarbonate transport system ATPase subunit
MQNYSLEKTLVKISNINHSFGDKQVLKNINAEVKDIVRPGCVTGQVVGILGPSGIGKSILSRIMAGLLKPTSGKIFVGEKQEEIRSGLVGMIAQNYPLFRHRTVYANLLLAAKKGGNTEDKVKQYLSDFNLSDKVNNYPSQLSGGQRQRVAIIQQLLCSEHFIIMDEPTTGLDPIMKDKVCDLIIKIAHLHEENTLFIVTHDIPASIVVCDQLWLFGRDRDEQGNVIPGATIQEKYNLIERELCWEPGIQNTPKFASFVNEVKDRFKTL